MLTRAQLLMGNSSQGVVLAGQTQGVRQGVGVIIAADGTISFDSVTATGIVKTNNPTAYNAYVWPTTLGAVGQQLQLGAAGALSWEDPDQIPWTAKGELIVGTGLNTSTILSVGVDGSILIADSTQASGLGYTTNFVATTGATSAANLPAGATGLRPVTPSTGAFRYNSTTTSLEFYNGSGWETVASSSTNSFVEQTSTTGAAVMPAGTQLQRPGSPGGGYLRFNDDTDKFEFFNGTTWESVASSSLNTFVEKTSDTGIALIPAGTSAQRPVASTYAGGFRYNSDLDTIEFSDGVAWKQLVMLNNLTGYNAYIWPNVDGAYGSFLQTDAAGTLSWSQPAFVGSAAPSPASDGMLWFDCNVGYFKVYQSCVSPVGWTAVSQQPGLGLVISGSAIKVSIPVQFGPPAAGTLPAESVDGSLYWDNNLGLLFIRYNDGTSTQWVQVTPSGGGGSGTVTSVDVAGTGGITSTGGPITTSGVITVDFSLPSLPVLP